MSFYSALPSLQAANGPLYHQFQALLMAAIEDGRLKHNDALPPERDLAVHYNVSRLTVRKGLAELEKQGLVVRRRGAGTFISLHDTDVSTPERRRDNTLVPEGEGHSVWLQQTVECVVPDEAMIFGVPLGTEVARLKRLRHHDGAPVALERSVVLRDCLPAEPIEGGLYAAMQKSPSRPARALQRLRAVAMPAEAATLLNVAEGSPALYMERRSFLRDGRAAELTCAWYRGDRSDLVSEINGSGPSFS